MLPVVLVPETTGFTVAVGILIMGPVDRETLATLESEFAAVTLTITCLPGGASLKMIERPEVVFAIGTKLFTPELFPSWPAQFPPQHCNSPVVSSAQLWVVPVEIDAAFEMPDTWTGTRRVAVLLLPNWPEELTPQHSTVPLANNAQVWSAPFETDLAEVMPDTVTGTRLSTVLLLPSWPKLFTPQHRIVPLASNAQVWTPPLAIEIDVADVIPETVTGTRLLVVLLLPSCPELFFPQHWTLPLASRAQVWS
jgi:hypothetical protein